MTEHVEIVTAVVWGANHAPVAEVQPDVRNGSGFRWRCTECGRSEGMYANVPQALEVLARHLARHE